MKGTTLKFGYAPRMIGRNSGSRFAAYKSDGNDQVEQEEKDFQESIKDLSDGNKAMAIATRKSLQKLKSELEAGMISKEAHETEVKAIKEKYKSENAELQKELDKLHEFATKQSKQIQDIKINGNSQKAAQSTMIDLVDQNMGAVKSWFEGGRQGELVLSMKFAPKEGQANKVAANMTTSNAIDYSGLNGTEISNFRIDSFVPKRWDRQFIFDFADRVTTASVPEYIIWDEEGAQDGSFAVVTEGSVKPLTQYAIVENKSKAKKAAGKMVVTTEFEKFKSRAAQIIRGLFNDKLMRDYQGQLTTDLLAAATAYVGTALDGTVAKPTDFHAVAAVAAQLETLNFSPDTLVIHPQDKWRMALTQDSTGQFLIATIPVAGANGQIQLMSFNTITSTKMTLGTFMLGEGKNWKIEDEAVTLRMGPYGLTMNGGTAESDFDFNRIRLIGELFFHSYIPTNLAGSFCKASFATMKDTLQGPVMA